MRNTLHCGISCEISEILNIIFPGLDPAEPAFENHPEGVRIDPSDAVFVDIIHTNGAPIRRGGAGLMQVSGHVDFYVNGGERQPGCPNLVTGTFEQLFSRNVSGKLELLCKNELK